VTDRIVVGSDERRRLTAIDEQDRKPGCGGKVFL
jgi:hypothetical protein